MNKKTIAILTPCYNGDFDSETKKCVEETRSFLKTEFNIVDITSKETYIHRGRRMLLQKAIEIHKYIQPIDYVLWLDSDVVFNPNQLTKLISRINDFKLSCLSGVYFSRHGNNNPMFCYGNIENGFQFHNEIIPNKIIEVDAVGFGFFLIPIKTILYYVSKYKPTEWFESNKWFPESVAPHNRIYVVGEDLDWCVKAKQIGIKISVDTSVLLNHNGITINDWNKNKNKIIPHCEPIVRGLNEKSKTESWIWK